MAALITFEIYENLPLNTLLFYKISQSPYLVTLPVTTLLLLESF